MLIVLCWFKWHYGPGQRCWPLVTEIAGLNPPSRMDVYHVSCSKQRPCDELVTYPRNLATCVSEINV